jgi:hypothetical protein
VRKFFPDNLKASQVRHLNTLAALVCGIIRSQNVQLPQITRKVPGGSAGYAHRASKSESRTKLFYRWMKNEKVTHEIYFLPFAQKILNALAHAPLVMVMDGTVVGRDCMALVIAVVYKQRALPIAWLVEKKKKGHFSEEQHIKLVQSIEAMIPDGARIVLLGDGEFDGVDLQEIVNHWHWDYVLRTAETTTLCFEDHWFSYKETLSHVEPGGMFVVPEALFTQRGYGPVLGITWWRKDCKEPIHLVTNLRCPDEACRFYKRRFKIETCFSDQKGRGFNLQKSHLSSPERLNRLLMAAFMAYHFVVALGILTIQEGWQTVIHRTERCDLSLFQLGLRLLDHLLESDLPIRVSLNLIC